jgi:hypothetical protein
MQLYAEGFDSGVKGLKSMSNLNLLNDSVRTAQ